MSRAIFERIDELAYQLDPGEKLSHRHVKGNDHSEIGVFVNDWSLSFIMNCRWGGPQTAKAAACGNWLGVSNTRCNTPESHPESHPGPGKVRVSSSCITLP